MKRIIKSVSVAVVIIIAYLYSFSIISFASDGYTYYSQATTFGSVTVSKVLFLRFLKYIAVM